MCLPDQTGTLNVSMEVKFVSVVGENCAYWRLKAGVLMGI